MKFRIIRLQVQTAPLKVGRAPLRTYDPTPIESVPRLEVGPSGVFGIGRRGERLMDVHHVEHPRSRDRKGMAGLSFMGTGDYIALRARFGAHLTEGIAGESILVEASAGLAHREMPEQLAVTTADGPIAVHSVRVAEPCVEFARFCLRLPTSPAVGPDVQETLRWLDDGARGYRGVASGPGSIRLGDLVDIAFQS